jgi:hypothetical protein
VGKATHRETADEREMAEVLKYGMERTRGGTLAVTVHMSYSFTANGTGAKKGQKVDVVERTLSVTALSNGSRKRLSLTVFCQVDVVERTALTMVDCTAACTLATSERAARGLLEEPNLVQRKQLFVAEQALQALEDVLGALAKAAARAKRATEAAKAGGAAAAPVKNFIRYSNRCCTRSFRQALTASAAPTATSRTCCGRCSKAWTRSLRAQCRRP